MGDLDREQRRQAGGVEPVAEGGSADPLRAAALHRRMIQRKAAQKAAATQSEARASVADAPARGPGAALPGAVKEKMEGSLGADFSSVRVHEGGEAQDVGALAFTRGDDVHFAPGQYDPASAGGQRLLGHELAHVVQQRDGRVSTPQGKGGNISEDDGLEKEADELGDRAAEGLPAVAAGGKRSEAVGAGAPIQRKIDPNTPKGTEVEVKESIRKDIVGQ